MGSRELAWYALRVRSRCEFAVRAALETQGIASFLPTWEETTRWTDRIAKVTRPLFCGYIFVRCVPTDVLQILQTRGAVEVLGQGKPEAIPDEAIENVRRVAADPAQCAPAQYQTGEQITIERGAFAGCAGFITRVRGGHVLTVPLEILGRAVNVQIDAADVAPGKKEK